MTILQILLVSTMAVLPMANMNKTETVAIPKGLDPTPVLYDAELYSSVELYPADYAPFEPAEVVVPEEKPSVVKEPKKAIPPKRKTETPEKTSQNDGSLNKKFCWTIAKHESGYKQLGSGDTGNYHGVLTKVNGKRTIVNFPWTNSKGKTFQDSYQWCYNTVPDFKGASDMKNYVCNVYGNANVCGDFEAFYAEVKANNKGEIRK